MKTLTVILKGIAITLVVWSVFALLTNLISSNCKKEVENADFILNHGPIYCENQTLDKLATWFSFSSFLSLFITPIILFIIYRKRQLGENALNLKDKK